MSEPVVVPALLTPVTVSGAAHILASQADSLLQSRPTTGRPSFRGFFILNLHPFISPKETESSRALRLSDIIPVSRNLGMTFQEAAYLSKIIISRSYSSSAGFFYCSEVPFVITTVRQNYCVAASLSSVPRPPQSRFPPSSVPISTNVPGSLLFLYRHQDLLLTVLFVLYFFIIFHLIHIAFI